ncbi:MAG: hypothetical protein KatS3mg120_2178 [Erythrobacter sp.]|nr:MAG: hypothetical protein KatS3mg120_2178 [Erythrobacter sp.]
MAWTAKDDQNSAAAARLRRALERELAPEESILWHGWQLGRIEPKRFLIYVFAVPWTAFALLWTGLAMAAMLHAGEDGPGFLGWAFPLFGLPFVAVGLLMLAIPFGPLIARGRVLYVITDRRVLRLSLARALEVKTVPGDRLGLSAREERRDGSGTLSLAVRIGRDSDGDKETEFFRIGPVADVMGAQEATARIARPRPAPGPAVPASS